MRNEVVFQKFHTIDSWTNTKINNQSLLDPAIHQKEVCWREALAYVANLRVKVKRMKKGKGPQTYRILAPPSEGPWGIASKDQVKILDHCIKVGMPTSDGRLKKLKGYKICTGSALDYRKLVEEIGATEGESGGGFVGGFVVKSDYNKKRAVLEVYKGKGEPLGEGERGHAVSVVGLGCEETWVQYYDRRMGDLETELDPFWFYQNSYGPNWSIGKISCDEIIKAWVPYV